METWTPERLKKARENWEAGNQKPATQTTKAPEAKASPKETSGEWTPERIKKARESWETGTPARAAAVNGMTAAGNLSGQVLAQMMGSTGSTNPKLQLAVPQTKQSAQAYPGKNGIVTGQSAAQTTPLRGGTAQPEWLTKAQPENRTAEKTSAPGGAGDGNGEADRAAAHCRHCPGRRRAVCTDCAEGEAVHGRPESDGRLQ